MATYWQQLQLSFDPFMLEQTNETPYLSPRFEQQLDLLVHLATSENKIQLVTGLTGIGKTTMMRLFLKELVDSVAICKVHGGATITPDVLQELLARHLNISVDASQTTLYKQALQAKMLLMQQKQQHFYLLIDNAHKLPKASLAFLLDIMSWQPENSNVLHMVLFGGPQLEAIFAELTATALGEHKTHTIRLEPLSEEEVRDYIQHRLTLADWDKVFPFLEVELKKITQVSNGIPAKINYLAKQVLQKKVQAYPNQRNKDKKKTGKMKNISIGVAVILIGFIVFNAYETYEKSQSISNSQQKLAIHAEPMSIQAVKSVQPVASPPKPINQQQIAAQEQTIEGLQPEQEPAFAHNNWAESKTPEKPHVTTRPKAVAVAPQALTSTPTQQVKQETITKVQPPKEVSSEKIKQPAQLTKPSMHYALDEQEIMDKSKEHYTLQLAGSHNLAYLKQNFIVLHNQGSVYYFKTTLSGKAWYVAIYGDYKTHAAAKQAINKLPEMIKNSHPWPRTYASIQNNIKG